MQPLLKLLTLLSLLLLPLRVAEAHVSKTPDAVIAALDLGHCMGGDSDKQHGRGHAHCSIAGEAASDASWDPLRLVEAGRAPALPRDAGSKGLRPKGTTPPPRI